MDIAVLLRFARKWAWLVVLAAFVAGGVTFILNTGTPPVYQATTMMTIGSYLNSANPAADQLQTAQSLVASYLVVANTRAVLEAALAEAGLEGTPPEVLAGVMRTDPIEGTGLFTITVTFTDPVVAADLANALANQLIAQAPGLNPQEQERLANAHQELDRLNAMRDNLDEEQSRIETELANATGEAETRDLQNEFNSVMSQRRETSNLINAYQLLIDQIERRNNQLSVQEVAKVPTGARSINLFSTTLFGAGIGAALALAAVVALEYLDDVIRSSETAVQTLGLPVLGAIMRIGKRTDKYNDRLVYNYPSMSPIAEGYRTLRTNLLFSSGNTGKGVYIITSPSPEEGKSMTTANLAITMALAGLQVLLIDADLRRPRMHEIFELENNVGLTTLLFADPGSTTAMEGDNADEGKLPANLRQCLQNTSVPRLRVITSGFIPSNPTEILGSALMQRWVDAFRASPNIDVVLIDTPPCLMVADSTVLAATAKSDVLLVMDASKTRRGAALKAKERFQQLGLEIKGVIINRLNPRDETYEYTYTYGYYYTPTPKGNQRGRSGGSRRERQTPQQEAAAPKVPTQE